MPEIKVRDVPEPVKKKLAAQAVKSLRSLNAQIIFILTEAVK
jgi:hypothetical protein